MGWRDLEVRAKVELWDDSVGLQFRERGDPGEPFRFGTDITMVPIAAGLEKPTTCRLSSEQAQALMDQLWQCGLRPTEGTGSAGALRAVENHRDDLRKLLFHKEGIQQ